MSTSPPRRDTDRELVDACIAASRALVAVAARSLADLGEEVTLPQYRTLVVLRTQGPQRAGDVAAHLGVTPSTASRMIERLVRKRLVRRVRTRDDRRTLRVSLTDAGADVVAQVTARRRVEIEGILEHMPVRGRKAVAEALRRFAEAAGEVPEPDWALGWDQDPADTSQAGTKLAGTNLGGTNPGGTNLAGTHPAGTHLAGGNR